ncbi:chromate transporter [Papillibacter cinnamivorans]|uniref:Chromate transporter n=1 Tax=Papillibacter cinnamivorans DSM 12816 TaxID=1122930 RepID=A0A1W1ZD86_9FIRM|nr:chromate transporter [Papillibacter cinnamivorans]SMC46400.1 chromate transporter [Papillibacter cinnamivorans DSM 12816]
MEKTAQPHPSLLKIFLITLRVGFFTFGGGMVMFAMLEREFSDRQGWLTKEEMIDLLAIAQSLPGVIAVNSSLLMGYRLAGTLGALVAVLGSVIPSFVVLAFVAIFYDAFITNPYFAGALRGVQGAVVGLLVSVLLSTRKKSFSARWGYILFPAALCVTIFIPSFNIVFLLLGGAAIGILVNFVLMKKRRPEDYE